MKLPENPKLEILRSSDNKYEKLTAEICYSGEPVAQINHDKGKNSLEIEIFNDFGGQEFVLKVPLSDFLKAVDLAKNTLLGH